MITSRPPIHGPLGWCSSVEEATANGWRHPYVGNHGHIYGRWPGNHRCFRCSVQPVTAQVATRSCPECYGGHFRPCQACGDTGRI